MGQNQMLTTVSNSIGAITTSYPSSNSANLVTTTTIPDYLKYCDNTGTIPIKTQSIPSITIKELEDRLNVINVGIDVCMKESSVNEALNALEKYFKDRTRKERIAKNMVKIPKIKKVIFNPPATIVYWEDESKTVVKAGERDEFDEEVGLAMAIARKYYDGNRGEFLRAVENGCRSYSNEEA